MTITTPELFLLLIAVSGPLKVTIVCATLTTTASSEFINRVAARAVVISASVFVLREREQSSMSMPHSIPRVMMTATNPLRRERLKHNSVSRCGPLSSGLPYAFVSNCQLWGVTSA